MKIVTISLFSLCNQVLLLINAAASGLASLCYSLAESIFLMFLARLPWRYRGWLMRINGPTILFNRSIVTLISNLHHSIYRHLNNWLLCGTEEAATRLVDHVLVLFQALRWKDELLGWYFLCAQFTVCIEIDLRLLLLVIIGVLHFFHNTI